MRDLHCNGGAGCQHRNAGVCADSSIAARLPSSIIRRSTISSAGAMWFDLSIRMRSTTVINISARDPDPNVRLQLRLDAEHRDF